MDFVFLTLVHVIYLLLQLVTYYFTYYYFLKNELAVDASCNLFCIITVLEAETSKVSYIPVGGFMTFFFKSHPYKK